MPSAGKIEVDVVVDDGVTVPGGLSAFERRMQAVAALVAGRVRRPVSLVIALVGDVRMQELNKRALQHDEPTDVLAFPYASDPILEGELILSVDTACREARARGHEAVAELVLYAVHGCLHLVGYDDHDPASRRRMRAQERRWLAKLGLPAVFGRAR